MADAVHTRRAILRAIPSIAAVVSVPACAGAATAVALPLPPSAELEAAAAAFREAYLVSRDAFRALQKAGWTREGFDEASAAFREAASLEMEAGNRLKHAAVADLLPR